MGREYITLVTSLPHLPHFERADRLPITERALTQRLSMLDEHDLAQLRDTVALLRWRRHSVEEPTESIEQNYRKLMEKTTNPALRDYIDWRIGGRAAMAALRLKAIGLRSRPEKAWGAGRFVRAIERNWEKNDIGLAAVFPWLIEARQMLARGEALPLERLQMAVVWQRLTRLGEGNPFGFEFVAAYVLKWDILQRWISYEPQQARQRFENLIQEVISGYQLTC